MISGYERSCSQTGWKARGEVLTVFDADFIQDAVPTLPAADGVFGLEVVCRTAVCERQATNSASLATTSALSGRALDESAIRDGSVHVASTRAVPREVRADKLS